MKIIIIVDVKMKVKVKGEEGQTKISFVKDTSGPASEPEPESAVNKSNTT